jgi:hypothetical protein
MSQNRIAHCPACAAHANGVKSRIALEHTCGLEQGDVPRSSSKVDKAALKASIDEKKKLLSSNTMVKK